MSQFSKLLMTCLAAISLAGCAAKNVRNDFNFSKEGKEGIVVISVSHDDGVPRNAKAIFYIDGSPASGGTMVRSIDDIVPGIAGRSEFEDSRGRLMVLALPPGRHAFNGWQIFNGTGMWIGPAKTPSSLVFEVVSGEAIYLGNLHAHLLTGKNIFGITIVTDGYPEIRDLRDRDMPLLESRYPQFKGLVKMAVLPLGPWPQSGETSKVVDVPILPALPVVK